MLAVAGSSTQVALTQRSAPVAPASANVTCAVAPARSCGTAPVRAAGSTHSSLSARPTNPASGVPSSSTARGFADRMVRPPASRVTMTRSAVTIAR